MIGGIKVKNYKNDNLNNISQEELKLKLCDAIRSNNKSQTKLRKMLLKIKDVKNITDCYNEAFAFSNKKFMEKTSKKRSE
jgi:late competence protein required for DNA uptake (superfamily II DNA/RNA helicase)